MYYCFKIQFHEKFMIFNYRPSDRGCTAPHQTEACHPEGIHPFSNTHDDTIWPGSYTQPAEKAEQTKQCPRFVQSQIISLS